MAHELTALLLAQRAAGTTLDTVPAELVPADLDAAYVVQSETIAALGAVGAWKVAPIPPEGAPVCSPLLASAIYADGAQLRHADLPGLAIEVEVAVTLAHDLDDTATADEVRKAIGSVHLALELLSSRFTDRNAIPRLVAFADLQNGGGIVLGAPVHFSELPEFGNQAMTMSFDGQAAGSTEAGPTTANMLAALTWLGKHSATRGTPLRAGTVVITGARIGPVAFDGHLVEARSPGLGTVSAAFLAKGA